MAVRPTWKGYLKVSLVTIPVKVFPATESAAALSFNNCMPSARRAFSEALVPALGARGVNSEFAKG
jgi:DNA end-binding protein Ku